MEKSLFQYAVYDRPSDFPEYFVIRKWEIDKQGRVIPKEIVFVNTDIDVIRGFLQMRGLVNIGRFTEDDPKILEVWI